jgi:hypothetical protein
MRERDLMAEIEQAQLESSNEAFDRMSFAKRALDLVSPPKTTIALCEGIFRVHVETGRQWGKPDGQRWALVSVPPRASRRAIALAIAELAQSDVRPWVLDVLLSQ